jgi:hypothetical protein
MIVRSDIFGRLVHLVGVVVLSGLLLLCVFGAQAARAETEVPGTGWEVTSTTYPTDLVPGSAVNEVQEVMVAATEGTFTLSFGGDETAAIPFDAPAATVQAALEGLPSVGAGNVTITGGPGDATGTKPYVLTFTGTLAGREVGEVVANGEQLAGGTVTVTVKTEGKPSGTLELNVYNVGAEFSKGTVTVTDVLPPGVVATEAGSVQDAGLNGIFDGEGLWECSGIGTSVVSCTNTNLLPSLPIPEKAGNAISEEGAGAIEHIGIAVRVEPGTPERLVTPSSCTVDPIVCNRVTVAGGGAASPASTSSPVTVSSSPASSFGFQDSDGWFSSADGAVDTQAGSHPYGFTYSFDLNTFYDAQGELNVADGEPRNFAIDLPPGFIGNPTAVPECTRQQFDLEECSPSTQVGIDVPEVERGLLVPIRFSLPIYNLVPPPGIPAQFALDLLGSQTFLDASVRSGGDYGISVNVYDLVQKRVMGNRITFWGEPSDPSHDEDRTTPFWQNGSCKYGCSSSAPRVPFLTTPTSCSGPQTISENLNTWETAGFDESSFAFHDANDIPTGFTGCDFLGFDPTISVAPDTTDADTPAGLTVDVKVPQEGLTTPGALATSNIRDTTVALPPGLVINPGQATGLQACQEGPTEEFSPGVVLHPGRDNLPLAGENGEEKRFDGPADCPKASKVGTIEIETPLLSKSLHGNAYVLQSNPPNLQLLLTAEGQGVFVKLISHVSLCEAAGETIDGKTCTAAGQLISRLEKTPELPFTNFKLSFSGGAQAALDTPTTCGTYGTTSDFTPWSAPTVGDVFPTSNFTIDTGCPSSPLPFSPSLTAGSTTDQAGGFTNFSLLLQRADDQQRISGLQFKAPPGLLAYLPHIAVCTNAQVETNTCPEASKIGHTVVESGPGPYPLVVPEPDQQPAPIYLTGPYNGTGACTVNEQGCAPFGLSIVVPLHVGPFELPTQRVRARIEIDPRTTQLTVTTNPLPQEVAGVPTDLREVDAVIERPEFMINPTNCTPSTFSGTATGAQPPGVGGTGASAAISSPFGVGSCQSLKFTPTFTATTSGKVTKKTGTSLVLKIARPAGPDSQQANFSRVKIALPKQLPSRLTTLQKACTAKQFSTDPANCPPASIVGHVKVLTPVLPVPLEGPAYFVSNGGEAFPNLVFLLQGDNVNIETVSDTFISKAGITTGSLKTVPDAPFTSFELTLPSGPDSVFTGLGNLCTQKLVMPTAFVAQNGLEIHQNTNIAVTGCPKTKTLTRAQKLTTALKACHKDKNKTKRQTCEKQAHKKYGPIKKTKKKK